MTEHTTFVARARSKIQERGDANRYAFVSRQRGQLTEEFLTFTELDLRARGVASWLTGHERGDSAALLLYPAGLEFLTSFLGCLYARVIAIPAPLPTIDPRALERALRIIEDVDVRLVLTDSANQAELRGWLETVGLGTRVECVATDIAGLDKADGWSMPELAPDTVAYLQYTSGSTSEPRGVVITQGNLLHNARDIWRVIGSPQRGTGTGWLPHHHDMGLVGQLLQPLYVGADLAFTSPLSFAKRPVIWLEMISRYRAEYTGAPNFGYEWCANQVSDEQIRGLDLSSLKVAMNGAEPVRAATLRKVAMRFGHIGFRPQVWRPVYGMAESTLLVTGAAGQPEATVGRFDQVELERHRAVASGDGTTAKNDVELVSCGAPVGLELRIVDTGTLDILPDGRVGEIWVRGPSVAKGYWQQPQATKETFDGRTSGDDGPYLRTGDLGFVRDGNLYVTGRLKDVLIVNGRNIYPQDVEEAARVHSALGVGAAFAVETDREHAVLVQEVLLSRLGVVPFEELAGRIDAAIGDGLRLPAVNIVLVRNGCVERTTSGKVKRSRTRELFLSDRLTPLYERVSTELRDYVAGRLGHDVAGRVDGRSGAHGSSPAGLSS